MKDIPTGPTLSRPNLFKLGLGGLVFASGCVALGVTATGFNRWLALIIGYVIFAISFDFWLRLLPEAPLRESVRMIVALPYGLIMSVLVIVGPFYKIFAGAAMFVSLCAVSVSLVFRIAFPFAEGSPVHAYFILLLTLTAAAYAQDAILWPLEKIMNPFGDPEHDVRREFEIAARLIRFLNPRRLAYQFAFLTYLTSVILKLQKVILPTEWEALTSFSFEALVGFLAVDAYISAFHPKIIQRRPLWSGEKQADVAEADGNQLATPQAPI